MTHAKNHLHRGHKLTSLFVAFTALCLFISTAPAVAQPAPDWDGDGIEDAQDWGVALTFDLHPTWEQPSAWYYPTDWAAGKPSILDILSIKDAKSTFFVSGFANAATGTWNTLLDNAVDQGHELAFHGREHIDIPKWDAESGWSEMEPWPSAFSFVYSEVQCDVSNYDTAKGDHTDWPDSLSSYAYPGCLSGNPGDPQANWFLSQHMGHARAADAPAGPYGTETIANQFDLKGYWLDNSNICRFGACSTYEAVAMVSQAYLNHEIVVFAAHHLTDSSDPSLLATQMWKLLAVLDHINCLQDGGTLESNLLCTPPAQPDHSGNPTVYHRFEDLPTANTPPPMPAGDPAYCQLQSLSSCGG